MVDNEEIIDVSYVDDYVYTKDDLIFMKNYTYRETVDHIYIKRYIGEDVDIVIPDSFKNKPITFADKGFFDECKLPVNSISFGDNLISFPAKVQNIKTLKKVRFGKRLNCIEGLLKDSTIEIIELGNNHNYKIYEGCLISYDGKSIVWNEPTVKKIPEEIENVSTACQFYDSIYLPSSIIQVHVDSFKTKKMIIYYGGGKLEWSKVKFVKTLTPHDLKKGIFDNEIHAKDTTHKFKKVGKKCLVDIKFKYLEHPAK